VLAIDSLAPKARIQSSESVCSGGSTLVRLKEARKEEPTSVVSQQVKQEVPGTTSKITVDVELLRLPDAEGDGELVPYVQLSIDLLADMLEQPDRWIIEWQHYLDCLQDNLKLVRLLLGWKAKIHVRFAVLGDRASFVTR
jgi:hypothetical protein